MAAGPSRPSGLQPTLGPRAMSSPPLPSPLATKAEVPTRRNSRRTTCKHCFVSLQCSDHCTQVGLSNASSHSRDLLS